MSANAGEYLDLETTINHHFNLVLHPFTYLVQQYDCQSDIAFSYRSISKN